jgi:hypothetical protein
LKLLKELAQNMEQSFAPYIEELYPIVENEIDFMLSKDIRKNAVGILTAFTKCLPAPQNCNLF